MRKIILAGASLAALTVSAPAFAQSASPDPAVPVGDQPAACAGVVGNCAILNQDGSENIAQIDQGQNTGGTGNIAVVDQTGTHGAPGNDALVDQEGDDNFAFLTQDTDATNTTPVDGDITQDGINSLAQIDQIGNAAGGSATIIQDSLTDFSFAEIEQTGAVGGGANTATIDQRGGFINEAAIVQGRTTAFDGSLFSPAGVVTDSDGANATITQIGDFNGGSVIQGGTNATATVDQDTSGTTAIFGNFAIVIQGSGDVSDMNFADVDQTGDNNTSEVYQNDASTGGNNMATVMQFGDDGNLSRITQNGSDHTAMVTQYDGSTSIITQSGTGNNVTVVQGTP